MHSSVQGQQRIELFEAPGAYKFILTVFILKSKQCTVNPFNFASKKIRIFNVVLILRTFNFAILCKTLI